MDRFAFGYITGLVPTPNEAQYTLRVQGEVFESAAYSLAADKVINDRK